jgi:uncharacterized protein (TIGR01777 family)
MRIVVAGGTGFLGRPLCTSLAAAGHEVVVLTRGGAQAAGGSAWRGIPGVASARWGATTDVSGWVRVVDDADVVVNLAGESIASGRWTGERKRRLAESRLEATRGLVKALGAASPRPRGFVSASAIGYYGSRGDEPLTEDSSPGADFLARLCVDWEAEASAGRSESCRVACVRTGIVLARDGGALAKMLLPFKLFAGGPMGSGRQYMSWIHRDDWLALMRWLIEGPHAGAFNATAPAPVTNAEFAGDLGRALGRPAAVPTPAFALRLALGEMADALLLSSQRALPRRAIDLGFTFSYTDLPDALESLTLK